MGFPEGVTTRGALPEDAQQLFELIEAADLFDAGENMVDLSDIESDWRGPDRAIADDVLLVESDGTLLAWAQVAGENAEGDVHPDHRGRGIGLALVEWTERAAREQADGSGRARVGQMAIAGLPGTRELFADRGYEKAWESWLLRMPADASMNVPEIGGEFTIRPARPEEDRAVYDVVENAFNEWEDRTPRTYEQWRSGTVDRPDFDRTLLLVAATADTVTGLCYGVQYPDEGWADQIAVVSEHRGRGLARAMLATLFGELRSRGETRLGLNTDSRTGALGLYLDLGMVVTQTFDRWSRTL
jgi:GNAT superfamily N-acetyltransferase